MSVLGVDPVTMIRVLQRHATWLIRVVIIKVTYPLILWWKPDGELVRPLARSAGDMLETAIGAVGEGGTLPKSLYFGGRKSCETSVKGRDSEKRALLWKETVKYAGLKEGDMILRNWQCERSCSRCSRDKMGKTVKDVLITLMWVDGRWLSTTCRCAHSPPCPSSSFCYHNCERSETDLLALCPPYFFRRPCYHQTSRRC